MKKTIGLLVLATAFAACSTITTTVDYDKAQDFSKYRTYGWVGTGNLGNDLLEKRIVAAVDQRLAAKGLTKSDKPDVLVAVQGRLSREVRITSTGTGYGYRRGMGMATATAKEIPVGTLIAIDEAETALKKSYVPKLEAVLPEAKVARYLQIENKIRAAIRYELAAGIPLVK